MSAKPKHSRTTARVLRIDPRSPEADIVVRAADAVRAGGVVCFPTRCLYGLGADARNEAALRRIFEIKQRPPDMPLLVLISHSAQMAALAERVPPAARLLMERFWPGRLTIVLPALPDLPPVLTAGKGKIGIRLAGHPVARALVEAVGAPLTGTSANVSGGAGCRQIPDLDPRIAQGADMVLDAGPLKGGAGSTVVDVTGETPVIIREGEVPKHEIIAALKSAV